MNARSAFLCGILLAADARAGETPLVLTLDRALELARAQGPDVLAARARVGEAAGALAGARAWAAENPLLSAAAGPRDSEPRVTDVDVELELPLGIGLRRARRVGMARADLERETAAAADATREGLGAGAAAFYRALHAERRTEWAAARVRLASELEATARARHETGDVPLLDLNLARMERARAESLVEVEAARRAAAAAELKQLLGLDPEAAVEVDGELGDRRHFELAALIAAAAGRSDLAALAAERRVAERLHALGRARWWPELGLRLGFERDEGTEVALAGLGFTLPVFQHGQEERGVGAARMRRLEIELDARRRTVEIRVRAALAAFEAQGEAARLLEEGALRLAEENESLAAQSYAAGKIGLPELLLVRREVLGTREEYLDRQLELALAGVALELEAGLLK